jgi:nickel/cobalt transporter (NiCoT) family protein
VPAAVPRRALAGQVEDRWRTGGGRLINPAPGHRGDRRIGIRSILVLIGILNLMALIGITKVFRQMRHGHFDEAELENQLNNRGFMNRFLSGATKAVRNLGTFTRSACCSAWDSPA